MDLLARGPLHHVRDIGDRATLNSLRQRFESMHTVLDAGPTPDSDPVLGGEVLRPRRTGGIWAARTLETRHLMPLSTQTQIKLEKASAAVEKNPDADYRVIRLRSGLPRREFDLAVQWLEREGHLARSQIDGEWRYRIVKPYHGDRETGQGKHYRG